VPFQIQVRFTSSNGSKYLKVFSVNKKISIDRNEAEKNVNSSVIALQCIHEAAKIAQAGQYQESRIHLISSQRLLQRTMKTSSHQKDYLSFIVQAEKLDGFMREIQIQEKMISNWNQDRTKNRDDESSKSIYQMKSVSLKNFISRS